MAVRPVARLGLEEIEFGYGLEWTVAGTGGYVRGEDMSSFPKRSRMKQPFALALAAAALLLLVGSLARAADAPARHSLESDYGFMIGHWTCHVTQAGTADRDVSVEYEWSFDKRVLRESMRLGPKLVGEFLTTYDQTADRFKGVGVGAWGYVVWENGGFHGGHLSERGFKFDGGKMTPVSRSEFERISDDHYVVRDFEAASVSGGGAATDTEDCIKVK